MQSIIVTCDSCSKDFKIKLKAKKVKDDLKEHYFQCSHCKFKYISFYTNDETRLLQKEIEKLRKKIVDDPDSNELKHKIKQFESKHKLLISQLNNQHKAH